MAVSGLSSVHDQELISGGMEILVITWNYPPRQGGMEQMLARVCAGLSKNHRVWVITAHATESIAGANEIIFRPASPGLIRYFLFAVVKGIATLRGNRNIHVVFAGSVLATPIVLLLARLFRLKAVVQAHGLDLIYRNWVYQFFIVRWLRYVDRIIANSRHTAQLAQQKGAREQAIAVIPPGVDWQRFQSADTADALKQAWGLANRKVILFVGRLARRKGVKEFIEQSLLHIVNQMPDVCFVIAGDNPTESLMHHDDVVGEIRQLISRYDLGDHVRWLGAVNDAELVQVYALCDVLVLPVLALDYDVEGFGMVALEAAAAGKPVVAACCGGVPDAVQDGVTGILGAPANYFPLSDAIIRLLDDPAARFAMGEAGRQRALAEFAWAKIVMRYEEIFSDLSA